VRIDCPFCGERDQSEFAYLGDARCPRPDASPSDAETRFFEAVYLRSNPAGPHEELWYHVFGCRAWLQVSRDTRSHAILAVTFAGDGAGR
jgi:heterotetrameric sarcosine oxidase delta subunit